MYNNLIACMMEREDAILTPRNSFRLRGLLPIVLCLLKTTRFSIFVVIINFIGIWKILKQV